MRKYPVYCALLVGLFSSGWAGPIFLAGTYEKGANLTTPRPQVSKFFKTYAGGFDVAKDGAAYKVFVDVTQRRDKPMYVRVEFENPLDSKSPLTEEASLSADDNSIALTSKPVKGLKVYSDYIVKVMLYDSKDSEKPLDVLEQKVRSYVDTRGKEPKIYKGMREKK